MKTTQVEKLISKNSNILTYIHFTNSIENVNEIKNVGLAFDKFGYEAKYINKRNSYSLVNENIRFNRYAIIIQLTRNVDILSLCSVNKFDMKVLPSTYIVGAVDMFNNINV